RRFKAALGVSPRQFQEACRLHALKRWLQSPTETNAPVTEAIYAAGFGSGSRVYEKLDDSLGMTPGQYRRGGQGLAISHAVTET
ncbi:helix-turn-helix domain-containing protein, partial [Acinetobacter baumannii]